MNQTWRNLFIWVGIVLFGYAIFEMLPFESSNRHIQPIAYSKLLEIIKEDKVSNLKVSGLQAEIDTKDGHTLGSYIPETTLLLNTALDHHVTVYSFPPQIDGPSLFHILLSWLPWMVLIGLSFYSMRQFQSGNSRTMGFGRSRARLSGNNRPKVTFADVAGIDEAKRELAEIVDFLKDAQKFQKLGARIPRGVLLAGPPGTGKTLLARAIAGEAGVPYFSISGSDFVEMFVGVGASRVRDMFDQAKKNAPCILFIDEIDAVGRHRGAGVGGGNDEREQTLNQLLVEMDGFNENQGVIVVAATNRMDILDAALLRPGRFDRQVFVSHPDINGREQILLVHVRNLPLGPDVDIRTIARGTPGFSGADLANLANEAALLAARFNKNVINMEEFDKAKDKVTVGLERRSLAMSDKDREIVAYHEAGHAIVAFYSPESDPIHKATIIPHGQALGYVQRIAEADQLQRTRAKFLCDLRVAMGGRVAEELVFGHDQITNGAASDIKMATNTVRHMVMFWGMSDRLGFQTVQAEDHGSKMVSDSTTQIVDEEIQRILSTCYSEVQQLLSDKIDKLHLLAKTLKELEMISGEDIKALLNDGFIPLTPKERVRRSSTSLPTARQLKDIDDTKEVAAEENTKVTLSEPEEEKKEMPAETQPSKS